MKTKSSSDGFQRRATRRVNKWRLLGCVILTTLCCHSSAQEQNGPPPERQPKEFRTGRYHCEFQDHFDLTLDLRTNGTYQISAKAGQGVRIVQNGDWKRKRDQILLTPKSTPKGEQTGYDFSRFYIDERFPDTLDWGGRGMDYFMFKRVDSEK